MRGDIRIVPLYSSSEGNSTLVTVNGHHILIDIGKNCKQCGLALQKAGVYPDDIEAVFLTHSHSDHISGVSVFMKKYSTQLLRHHLHHPLIPAFYFRLDQVIGYAKDYNGDKHHRC